MILVILGKIVTRKSNYAKHIENFWKYGILNITLQPFSYFVGRKVERGKRKSKRERERRGKR